jgi:hypothetical protein
MSIEPKNSPASTVATLPPVAPLAERRRTADRIFKGALAFNTGLTLFWGYMIVSRRDALIFHQYTIDRTTVASLLFSLLFFYVIWGYIWYAVKTALLKWFVGFTKEERRQAFSSRMDAPFDVASFVLKYSERRIRITDMIGRRGRFITIAMAGFFFLYRSVATDPTAGFATMFLQDNLCDAVITSWVFLGFFYLNGSVAAAFYGAQSRIMDGVLARANNLLITTLWTAFKFVMVPLGAKLASTYPPSQFAIVFALIWGSYIAADALAEIGGSLFGKQTLRVWGIGDVNRKSVGGTISGFAGALVFCLAVVFAHGLPLPWVGLAVVIAISNTVFELFSPRGTDDFFMATANALICLGFGVLMR